MVASAVFTNRVSVYDCNYGYAFIRESEEAALVGPSGVLAKAEGTH